MGKIMDDENFGVGCEWCKYIDRSESEEPCSSCCRNGIDYFEANEVTADRCRECGKQIGLCKDCKYFEYDSVTKVDGIPLILAHEICSRWGDGCKTSEDGYCFLYEPQESEG